MSTNNTFKYFAFISYNSKATPLLTGTGSFDSRIEGQQVCLLRNRSNDSICLAQKF